jgi:hypothetical protein
MNHLGGIMDARMMQILGDKPDMLSGLPEWMLLPSTLEAIGRLERTAVAEIAGRDSVAAAVAAARGGRLGAILPTVVYTGTEHGSWQAVFETMDFLEERLREEGATVFPPVVLGSPSLWHRLCGRRITGHFRTYGFYTPCLGCHLYFHAARIPLARRLGCRFILSGERESHDGRIKINQTAAALDAYKAFAASFGLELLMPVRSVESGREIEALVGRSWPEGGKQMECVLSRNYEGCGEKDFPETKVKRFLEEFAVPAAREEILKILEP